VSDPATVGARRATADIVIQIAGRVLNLALGVVVTAVLARTLGEGGFGQWSTILVVIQIAGFFTELGMEPVTVRQIAGDRERERDWLGALLSLRMVLAPPVAVACLLVNFALSQGDEMRVASIVMSALVIVAGPGVLRAAFQVRVRNDIPNLVMTVNSIAWTGAVLAIAAGDGGIVALSVAFVAVSALTTALQAGLALRVIRPRLGEHARRLWRPLLALSLPVGASALLITAYARIDQVIVFEVAGDRQAGLYAAAYRILEQSHFIPLAVMTTLFPIISATYGVDRERVKRLLQIAADYLSVTSFGALAFAIVAAEPIIRLLFGPHFVEAAPALPILMGAFVLISFGFLAGNMIIVLRLQRVFFRYALLALVFNVALNLALVPEYGFLAAAWVTVATEAVVVSLSARAVLRKIEFVPSVNRIGRAAAAALGMGLLIWALRSAGAPLGVLAATAVVAYPLLLLALRAVQREEIVAVLRRNPPPM
jgi:O-antigen/teichoic acid export membrane protein